MKKFIYQLYNDDRCSIVVAENLHEARVKAELFEFNHGWIGASVVEIGTAKDGSIVRVLAMDAK